MFGCLICKELVAFLLKKPFVTCVVDKQKCDTQKKGPKENVTHRNDYQLEMRPTYNV